MPLNYDPAKEQMPSKLDVGVLFPWMGFVVQSSSNGQRQGSNEWDYGLDEGMSDSFTRELILNDGFETILPVP